MGNKVTVNRIAEDGCVEEPEIKVIPTNPRPHAVILNHKNDILDVTVLGGNEILQFAFDASTGNLVPLSPPTVTVKGGSGPRHIVEHPTEPLVFVLNELDGSVSSLRRDVQTGALSEHAKVALMARANSGNVSAADIHLTPDGGYLYVTERSSSTICSFEVGDSGELIPIETVPTEVSPRSFAIDPACRFLAVAGQLSNALAIYRLNPENGRLTLATRMGMHGNPSWVEIIRLDTVGVSRSQQIQ